jgi:hypothetical protein
MVNYKIVNERYLAYLPSNLYPWVMEVGGDILETKTNQIIKTGLDLKKAKETIRHLNFGGGFDGETPAFFLKNIPT